MRSARLVGWSATWLFAATAAGWARPAAENAGAWEKEGLWHHGAGDNDRAIAALRAGLGHEP
jgi:hypothetical protein